MSSARLIRLTRTGGFAGLSRSVELDGSVDGSGESETVNRLATELAKLPPPGPGAPDGFMYQFTVVEHSGDSREYTVSEHEVPPSLHPLLADLVAQAAPHNP